MNKIIEFFNREQNLLVHLTITLFVLVFGVFFKLDLTEWLLIFFAIAFVITSELINSSIELVVDTYTSEFNSLAMVSKDVAAGAVLISAITSFFVGIFIFGPKILDLIKLLF